MSLALILAAFHIVAFTAVELMAAYDASWTAKGLAKFPSEAEGSGVVCFFAGTNRPSFKQVFWIETLVYNVPMGLMGLLLLSSNPHVWAWSAAGLAGMVTVAVGHVQGASAWKKLING